jgi:TRAP-type transport system small permease protein
LRLLVLERTAARWTRRLALLAGWLLLAVATVTVSDALLRKFLSRPIQGAFEASELLLAVMIFFAMPYTGLTDAHVVLDLLTNRLSARAQAAFVAVNGVFVAAFLAVVAWQLGLLAAEYARAARTTITMRIPVSPFIVTAVALAWVAVAASLVQALGGVARATWPGPGEPPGVLR